MPKSESYDISVEIFECFNLESNCHFHYVSINGKSKNIPIFKSLNTYLAFKSTNSKPHKCKLNLVKMSSLHAESDLQGRRKKGLCSFFMPYGA